MKPGTAILITIFLNIVGFAKAQDLSALDTIVYYSLINTSDDHQGNYDTIELINSPYQGNDGVYCNGIYIGDFDPNASLVQTPPLNELNDSTFAVSIEFKIDEAPVQISPIFVCGTSWRYLGIMAQSDSTFAYLFNNTRIQIPILKVNMGEWQQAACTYSMADSTATFWIDGQQVAMAKGALVRSDNDKRVSNTNSGSGFTMLGYLRNLIVYSDAGIISGTSPSWAQSTARIYPNPTSQELIIEDALYSAWTIYNLNGVEMATGKQDQQHRINVASLPVGSYILTLQSEQKMIVHQQQFQKI